MADVHTPAQRSHNMSRVKGRNTGPEMLVRRYLHAVGFRYGLHAKRLPGTPDLVLTKYKTVVFVHGCFWHLHPNCPKSSIPDQNRPFWEAKLKGNALRDQLNREKLFQAGWKVLVVWECELSKARRAETLKNLAAAIGGGSVYLGT